MVFTVNIPPTATSHRTSTTTTTAPPTQTQHRPHSRRLHLPKIQLPPSSPLTPRYTPRGADLPPCPHHFPCFGFAPSHTKLSRNLSRLFLSQSTLPPSAVCDYALTKPTSLCSALLNTDLLCPASFKPLSLHPAFLNPASFCPSFCLNQPCLTSPCLPASCDP